MDEKSCLNIFEGIPESETGRAEYFDTYAPECRCEGHCVSKHSTDPVEEEELLRLVIDDTHVKRDGEAIRLKSSFMQDSVSIGSSTLRIGKATKQEISDLIGLLTQGKSKKTDGSAVEVIGYLLIPSSWVRQREFEAHFDSKTNALLPAKDVEKRRKNKLEFTSIPKQAHAIYATGQSYSPSHAEIFGCNFKFLSSQSQRNRQATDLGEKLAERFTKIETIDEILDLGVAE